MKIGWHLKALEVQVVQHGHDHFEWKIATVGNDERGAPKTASTIGSGERWALLAAFRAAVERAEAFLKESEEEPKPKEYDDG